MHKTKRRFLAMPSQKGKISSDPKCRILKFQNMQHSPNISYRSKYAVYAITVFISAFLLFQVQPLLSKFILPWFGGTPAVWTSAMLFFQIILFSGYLYAHLISSHLGARNRFCLHLLVLGAAALSVCWNRLIPPASLRPTGSAQDHPLLQVLLLLGATVGLPYFALSSTGPLLQKWFSETFGISPYRLFALSNFGSLFALLSYPFFFEANYGIVEQASMWSVGFLLFVVCCAYCAWLTYAYHRSQKRDVSRNPSFEASVNTEQLEDQFRNSNLKDVPPSFLQMIGWITLPTLACVLFLAMTNHVCQNIATVPLLWIVPLAIYLLSFIVAFDHHDWYSRAIYSMMSLILLFLISKFSSFSLMVSSWLNLLFDLNGDDQIQLSKVWWLEAGLYFCGLYFLLVVCHGELARSKPSTRYLTRFYLTLSLGGAVGGILVNLLAINIFSTFFELPLSLICSAILCASLLYAPGSGMVSLYRKAFIACGTILGLVTCVIFIIQEIPKKATERYSVEFQSRNFYGLLSVVRTDKNTPEDLFTFISGHIRHGMQYADPKKRSIPLSYYGDGSGCQQAILYSQKKHDACHIGIIGLGVGTIATYARPSDRFRFSEINPTVIDIANNTNWFHYLSDCQGEVESILGDARLKLDAELRSGQVQQFDVLVLDAFSGDAIPTHLLTDQAIELYSQHLKKDGILVAHITNTYLDLFPVVSKLAQKHGYGFRRIFREKTEILNPNYYMLLSKDQQFLDEIEDDISNLPKFLSKSREVPLWTDDFTNLTRLLR